MKKIILIILVLLGLKTQAQVGTKFFFEDSSGNFIIQENQHSASMFFTDVLFIRNNGIESVEFNFNNQTTLADGETFVIDQSDSVVLA